MIESRQGQEIPTPQLSSQVLDPPNLVSGYRNSFPLITGSSHDDDHSPVSSFEVKNEFAVMAWTGSTLTFFNFTRLS